MLSGLLTALLLHRLLAFLKVLTLLHSLTSSLVALASAIVFKSSAVTSWFPICKKLSIPLVLLRLLKLKLRLSVNSSATSKPLSLVLRTQLPKTVLVLLMPSVVLVTGLTPLDLLMFLLHSAHLRLRRARLHTHCLRGRARRGLRWPCLQPVRPDGEPGLADMGENRERWICVH